MAEIHSGLEDFGPSAALKLWDFGIFNTKGSGSTCLLALDGSDHFVSSGFGSSRTWLVSHFKTSEEKFLK